MNYPFAFNKIGVNFDNRNEKAITYFPPNPIALEHFLLCRFHGPNNQNNMSDNDCHDFMQEQ